MQQWTIRSQAPQRVMAWGAVHRLNGSGWEWRKRIGEDALRLVFARIESVVASAWTTDKRKTSTCIAITIDSRKFNDQMGRIKALALMAEVRHLMLGDAFALVNQP